MQIRALAAGLTLALAGPPLAAQVDARLFRYPDVSATTIVFTYAGDLWTVPKSGGVATRLSSPKARRPGRDSHPMAGRSRSPGIMKAISTSTPCP